MSDNTDDARALIAGGMFEHMVLLSPVLDAADGLRADMERRGWSPAAAEHAALTWLLSVLPRATGST